MAFTTVAIRDGDPCLANATETSRLCLLCIFNRRAISVGSCDHVDSTTVAIQAARIHLVIERPSHRFGG